MSDAQAWLVQIEFKRLQTYLFKVPKLKAMLGANALVGETLRGRFNGKAFVAPPGQENLPALTQEKASLPPGVALEISPIADDPLASSGKDQDDPATAYKAGILSRDGGHLNVVFTNKESAEEFLQTAKKLVGQKLPGLPLSTRLFPLVNHAGTWEQKPEDPVTANAQANAEDVLPIPQFQVCEITGLEPASKRKKYRHEPEFWTSRLVEVFEDKASKFDEGKSGDILGLLRESLCRALEIPEKLWYSDIFPNDFEKVAPSGYLAVIVADGNNVGGRSNKWREGASSVDFFQREAHGEKFFYEMRVAVRKAVLASLRKTFEQQVKRIEIEPLPFRLMMLGGDDLLLVCDAPHAVKFALHYSEELKKEKLADGKPLDVGIGIAIVKSKFPFHRSHALAEQLQASAKRRFRALPEARQESTVDWLAISEAWHEEIVEVRRRDAVRTYHNGQGNETIILSRKPYTVTELKTLWDGTENAVTQLPRTQLMALVNEIEKGRRQADFAVELLGAKRSKGLEPVFPDAKMSTTIWHHHGNSTYSTALLDFLELYELKRMLNEPREIRP